MLQQQQIDPIVVSNELTANILRQVGALGNIIEQLTKQIQVMSQQGGQFREFCAQEPVNNDTNGIRA